MGTPYKMKGAPMQRNFGMSPAKQKDFNFTGDSKSTTPGHSTTKIAKTENFRKAADKIKTVSSKTNVGSKVVTNEAKKKIANEAKKKIANEAKKKIANEAKKKIAKKILSKAILPIAVATTAYELGMGNPKSAKATDDALKTEAKTLIKTGRRKTHGPKY